MTPYTTTNPPTTYIRPQFSIPDSSLPPHQRILARALAALGHGLNTLHELPPFLQGVELYVANLSRRLSTHHSAAELDVSVVSRHSSHVTS